MNTYDLQYVCHMFTGLVNWELVSGDPNNVTPDSPVTYVQGDPMFPQKAVFTTNEFDEFFLSINDQPRIVAAERGFMEAKFGGGEYFSVAYTPESGVHIEDDQGSEFVRIGNMVWRRNPQVGHA